MVQSKVTQFISFHPPETPGNELVGALAIFFVSATRHQLSVLGNSRLVPKIRYRGYLGGLVTNLCVTQKQPVLNDAGGGRDFLPQVPPPELLADRQLHRHLAVEL
jgi:hypothetical protein